VSWAPSDLRHAPSWCPCARHGPHAAARSRTPASLGRRRRRPGRLMASPPVPWMRRAAPTCGRPAGPTWREASRPGNLPRAMGSLIKKRRKRMRKKKHKKMLKATRWQRRAGK